MSIYQDPLTRIVAVHFGGGARYYLFVSTHAQQTWDGGLSPVEGPNINISGATSPFVATDLMNYANPFSPGPVAQETHPTGFPGIVSVQTDGIVDYEHSVTHDALMTDSLHQWVWEQFDNRSFPGGSPFVWQTINDAGFNINLIEAQDSTTFTVEFQGSNGDQTTTFFVVRINANNEDDQDLGTVGNFNLQIGPSANLVATEPDTFDLTLTRVSQDIWEFSSSKVSEEPDNFPGWSIDNTPFAPAPP